MLGEYGTWFLFACSKSPLKTLWEKEKLLVIRVFSIFHSVFYPFGERSAIFISFHFVVYKLFLFGRVQNLLFWKGLNLSSASAFNLVRGQILSFGEELRRQWC